MIINNLLSKSHFSLVQSVVCGNGIPWTYLPNTSGSLSEVGVKWTGTFASNVFQHPEWENDGINYVSQGIYQIVLPALLIALEKQNLELDTLYRIRAGLSTQTAHRVVHGIHIDFTGSHLPNPNLQTGLFYLNDSDGPTHIYDENDNVVEKIDPVANRWYNMHNNTPHASSTPVENSTRYILTYNYSVKEQI